MNKITSAFKGLMHQSMPTKGILVLQYSIRPFAFMLVRFYFFQWVALDIVPLVIPRGLPKKTGSSVSHHQLFCCFWDPDIKLILLQHSFTTWPLFIPTQSTPHIKQYPSRFTCGCGCFTTWPLFIPTQSTPHIKQYPSRFTCGCIKPQSSSILCCTYSLRISTLLYTP